MKHVTWGVVTAGVLAMVFVGCAQVPPSPQVQKYSDSELPVPADYKSWPKFLSDVQRADVKQVRGNLYQPYRTQH